MRTDLKAETGKQRSAAVPHSAFIVRCLSSLSPLLSPSLPPASDRRDLRLARAGPRKEPLPPELAGVGITERPGARIPLDLPFVDSDGDKTALGKFFDGLHPVILTMNYSDCPMLCSVQFNGLLEALRAMPWNLGEQFQMVTVSIDPLETPQRAALTKDKYLKIYNRPHSAAGWHLLTGREENIQKLAAAVGFRYKYSPRRGNSPMPRR